MFFIQTPNIVLSINYELNECDAHRCECCVCFIFISGNNQFNNQNDIIVELVSVQDNLLIEQLIDFFLLFSLFL